MSNFLQCTAWLATFSLALFLQPCHASNELGHATCQNGTWTPDGKLVATFLACPLPLNGKPKAKMKAAKCVMKKTGIYDEETKVVHRDKIAPTFCAAITDEDLSKKCREKAAECLKDGKDFFQDPKTDKEYKTWIPFFKCFKEWGDSVCHK